MKHDEKSTDRGEFLEGMRNGIPIYAGYLAVSFAFGISARESGLSAGQATLMSLTNLTSAGQFSALSAITEQVSYVEMAFLQLVINLRYILMSAALSQKIEDGAGPCKKMGFAAGITDEIFGFCITRKEKLTLAFSAGMTITAVAGWATGTFLGASVGEILPAILVRALNIAIYGMFIAILVPKAVTEKAVLAAVTAAMVMSGMLSVLPVTRVMTSGSRIIIITILISALAARAAPVQEEAYE